MWTGEWSGFGKTWGKWRGFPRIACVWVVYPRILCASVDECSHGFPVLCAQVVRKFSTMQEAAGSKFSHQSGVNGSCHASLPPVLARMRENFGAKRRSYA